jgi:prophage antirepressor-like protein
MDIVADIPQENNDGIQTNVQNLLVKQFQHLNIEIYGTLENPLFKAKDIGDLLEIERIRRTLEGLEDDCKILAPAPTRSGSREQWFLTEDGLYEVLFISRKPIAKIFKKWVRTVIKEIRLASQKDFQDKIAQQQLQLTYYQETTYEQVALTSILYVFTTDKDGVYKIGETKKTTKGRIQGLQTACVDDIVVKYAFNTCNSKLLESMVHYILDHYRCNANREHFRCKLDHIILVINTVGKVLNTCKSSFQTISKEELYDKIEMIVPLQDTVPIKVSKVEENLVKRIDKLSQQVQSLKTSKQHSYFPSTHASVHDVLEELFPENRDLLIEEVPSE